MKRKFTTIKDRVLEEIVRDSALRVGIGALNETQTAMLIRLIFSGISNYFYNSPDNVVELGYMKVRKNPEKEQLFAVDLQENNADSISNAETLYRYYKGDMKAEKELKETMNTFINELLIYSQVQSNNITKLTGKLRKGETKNGI